MGDQPYTDAELDAAAHALWAAQHGPGVRPTPEDIGPPPDPVLRDARTALRAVLPQHAARIRAEEREAIAQAIEAKADAHNARIADIAGVPNRGRDGMQAFGIRQAAAIARAYAAAPTEEPTDA